MLVKDYSDVNEDWKKSQSVERLLLEENEDKDAKEFSYNYKQCNFQTIWQDALKQHMRWQHSFPLKIAQGKISGSVGPAAKSLKNQQRKISNMIPVIALQESSKT